MKRHSHMVRTENVLSCLSYLNVIYLCHTLHTQKFMFWTNSYMDTAVNRNVSNVCFLSRLFVNAAGLLNE